MTEHVGEFVYSKKDLIGHGAFAVVFKGHHRKKEDFVVAIKVIAKKNLSKTQNLLAKEIKILKELHHENVVSLFDCQETSNNVFLVMEYCNGGDLADYLRDKGTLSEDTIHIFLRQIASAMCTLQSKGVVHRDLKPQNLLLHHTGITTPSPSEIKIKIADFGFARFLPGEMMAATLCGSPMYMAPEVIMSKAYDAKADLWSVGTIVYQCLTGKAPFQANSPQQLKKFYEKSKVVSPNIPAGTSNHLKDLLVGLLRRNPRDRLDFGEFFSHAFLTGRVPRSASTPVAVPAYQRKHSNSSHGTRSPSYSPNFGAEALGDIRVDLLPRMTPPRDPTMMSPQDPPTIMNISSSGNNSSGQHGSPGVYPPTQDDELAPEGFVLVPSNPETPRFQQQRNRSDPLFPFYSQSPPRPSSSPCSPSPPLSRTPKRATFTVGSPYSTSPASPASPLVQPPVFRSPSSSPSSAESPPIEMPIRKRTNSSPGPRKEPSTSPRQIPRSSTLSEGVGSKQVPSRKSPSPTQSGLTGSANARKQRNSTPTPKLSFNKSPTSSPGALKGGSQESSPTLKREVTSQSHSTKGSTTPLTAAVQAMNEQNQGPDLTSGLNQPALAGFSSTNMNKGLTRPAAGTIRRALSNIEPLVCKDTSPILSALACQSNVGMGVPITDLSEPGAEDKQMIRVHSCPAILAMGLPRKAGTLLTSPGFQLGVGTAAPLYRRNSGGGYTPMKSPPLSSSPTSLPTIPGSPTKTSHSKDQDMEMKPLRGLFTVGSSSPLDSDTAGIFGSPGKNMQNRKISTGETPAVVSQGTKVTWGFGDSLPPKQLMVSKETEALSPDMEGPIALIAPELPEDTLMDTEHTEGVRKLNFVVSLVDAILEVISARGTPFTVLAESVAIKQNESFLADQIGLKSDELRKMEQLVLYVKALRALNLSLLFAKGEISVGHLKPSNAVKNVLNDLNSRYHQCLEKASELKQLVEPGVQTLDGKAMTVSADRLMYQYAMEQCQNAALDELFGNPKECKTKYETAQVLLQGLEEDAHTDDDRRLLHKYKIAVDKRLTCISRTRSRKSSQSSNRGVNAW